MDVTAQTGRDNVKISRREFLFPGRHYYSTTHLIRLQGVVLYKIRQYFLAIFSTMETVPLYILRRLIQKVKLRQHRTIWQEATAWIFGSIQSLENEGILYVFLVFQTEEVGQKDGCGSQTQLRGVAFTEIGGHPGRDGPSDHSSRITGQWTFTAWRI